MASAYIDDILSNFDRNHRTNEETIKALEVKCERSLKALSCMKVKIISGNIAFKKYRALKDKYEQSLKAHAHTREELKQVCINYKDALDKCAILENENKILLANQEILKEKVIDLENKYSAILSHTNQLQMLIKQLETEKDALTVEKELENCNNKERNHEVIQLQKERDAMLNDLITFKDVILGKEKTCKRHVKLLTKYVKNIKFQGSNIWKSEGKDDDVEDCGNFPSNIPMNFKKVHSFVDSEVMSRAEQNFIDNCSDSSNGEVSVDTGRGSSCATSQDKYLSSPDYVFSPETPLKKYHKNVIKQIDAANSPIIIFPPTSVATSPIIFDHPAPLFDGQFDDYTDCFDGSEDIAEDVPLSEDLHIIQDQDKFIDVCTSPIPDLRKFIERGTSPNKNNDYIIFKESANKSTLPRTFTEPSDREEPNGCSAILEKQIQRCVCQKVNKKTLVDSSTSPVPESLDLRKFVEMGTSTVNDFENINLNDCREFKNQTSSYCEKSTCTEFVTLSHKKFVDVCTSPTIKSPAGCNGVDINLQEGEFEDHISKNSEKSLCTSSITQTEKQFVESSSILMTPLEQCELVETNMTEIFNKQKEKSVPKSLLINKECSRKSIVIDEKISGFLNENTVSTINKDNVISFPKEKLRSQEKVCLESNSSKNLPFENTTDSEVQHILNVMKLHDDRISPITPTTPSYSHYIKLLPDMNFKLAKIWAAIEKMVKMPVINNDSNSSHHTDIDEIEEIAEVETNINRKISQPKQLGVNKRFNDIVETVVIDTTNEPNVDIGTISEDIPCLEISNMLTNGDSNIIKSKGTESSTNINTELSPGNKTGKIIVIADIESQQQSITNDTGLNNISQDDIIKTNNTNNTEICNVPVGDTEVPTAKRISKIKNKSKLEKLRKKLLPTYKIKKMDPPIIKHSSKVHNFLPKNLTTLNHKLAYEKAVKVMAELRSNQEIKSKANPLMPVSDSSNKTELTTSESNEVNTIRSRNKRSSRIEDDNTVIGSFGKSQILEQNLTKKSPVNRKHRKRHADMEEDSLVGINKRVLRSSSISQITNEKDLPIIPNSNVTFEKNRRIMKPVIDLSKRLRDNVNDVSITPGNVGSLDINTDTDVMKNSAAELSSRVRGYQNNFANTINQPNIDKSNKSLIVVEESANTDHDCSELEVQVTNNAQKETIEILMETENSDSVKCTNEVCNVEDSRVISYKEFMESSNSDETQHEITSDYLNDDQSVNLNGMRQNNSKLGTERSLHVVQNDLTNTKQNISKSLEVKIREEAKTGVKNPVVELIPLNHNVISSCVKNVINYGDLDLYAVGYDLEDKVQNKPSKDSQGRKDNILCAALDRYGVTSVKYAARKVPDTITTNVCRKIEEVISNIIASSKDEQKSKMNDLVNSIQNDKPKYILSGLMKYLKDPTRKYELFNKVISAAAPPMTRSEMILLYVIEKLDASMPSGFINRVWNNMEHTLFQLNRAPEFGVIESMSHFYAVLCRYFRNKSRLRCFMLDAMYCLQFKAVPLISQCLDVCPGVLPYAHEHMAKTSLVTCLVYLLHFYKCQDKFNRAQDIRNTLSRKYSYRFSEWNETVILEIFRKAIMDLKGTHTDKKMLRVALIILCKRHGAKWCQLNIIQNMLLPIIEKKDVPERIKHFCVLMLGPLLKPFPADRKAQCEIVINQLLQMLKQDNSQEMNEAIYSSLIFMSKHDQERVVQALLSWNPETISEEFKEILNDYVMEKPLNVWKKLVTRKPCQHT